MRSIAATLVVALTLVTGAGLTGAAPAADPTVVRDTAITWLAPQVTDDGALVSPYTDAPDPSLTAQAALALAGAGAEPETVKRMTGWLETHVEDFVAPGGSADSPGALAWLMLTAVATGEDPYAFGGQDLASRLLATQQSDGLFGEGDATYDGAFRQALSLIALSASGETNEAGLGWLIDQQCADGGFVAFRTDTSVPCPAVDAAAFTGEDTNSTAMAAMALSLSGRSGEAAAAMAWLGSVRGPSGGFAYLGDASLDPDANSTGMVALAFRTVEGVADAGSIALLASLQVPASGDPLDAGGIAFQAGDPLVPDLMATTQGLLGVAGQGLPFTPVTPDAPTTTSAPDTTVATPGTGSPAPTAATAVTATPSYTG